jgi:hypothetical protein
LLILDNKQILFFFDQLEYSNFHFFNKWFKLTLSSIDIKYVEIFWKLIFKQFFWIYNIFTSIRIEYMKIFVYFLNLNFQSMFEIMSSHPIIASTKKKILSFGLKFEFSEIFFQWGRKMCHKINFKEKKGLTKSWMLYFSKKWCFNIWCVRQRNFLDTCL